VSERNGDSPGARVEAEALVRDMLDVIGRTPEKDAGALLDNRPFLDTLADLCVWDRIGYERVLAEAKQRKLGPQALGRAVKDILSRRPREAACARPLLVDVLAREVPSHFDLVYRCRRGAYSETEEREVSEAEFKAFCPRWLLDQCAEAEDCPEDMQERIQAVSVALRGVWSTVMQRLPREDQASFAPGSSIARRIEAGLFDILKASVQFEIEKTGAGTSAVTRAARSNLIERVRHQSAEYRLPSNPRQPNRRETWRRAQPSMDCFWKPVVIKGKVYILIGLLSGIGRQQTPKVELPGVHDQPSFARMLQQSGLAMKSGRVRNRLPDGRRLVVLSLKFTRKLFALPRGCLDLDCQGVWVPVV
jgi:hypothetical protein